MKEWQSKLMGHMAEEANDQHDYMAIADMADEDGCCHEAGVLRDIAHDEETHRHLIKEMLGHA